MLYVADGSAVDLCWFLAVDVIEVIDVSERALPPFTLGHMVSVQEYVPRPDEPTGTAETHVMLELELRFIAGLFEENIMDDIWHDKRRVVVVVSSNGARQQAGCHPAGSQLVQHVRPDVRRAIRIVIA